MSIFKGTQTAVKFIGGSYSTNVQGQTIDFPNVELKTALVSLLKTKKIIRGEIAGKDGEVIEYIGMSSHDVTISGVITGDNGVLPNQQVIDLDKLIDAPVAIDVVCPFLNQKGIYKLIIIGGMLPQEPGGISYQNFSLNCISEVPTELRISQTPNDYTINYNSNTPRLAPNIV